jgi:3-oxoacyl-(acyl-carrier-protein) synthase
MAMRETKGDSTPNRSAAACGLAVGSSHGGVATTREAAMRMMNETDRQ